VLAEFPAPAAGSARPPIRARAVDCADTAALLLRPFPVTLPAREHADGLAAAARRYGQDWIRSLLTTWFDRPDLRSGDGVRQWNSGVVQGHVNRIKILNRQMFGRAGFDLLRKRVLPAS
jgi:hypothetical protein